MQTYPLLLVATASLLAACADDPAPAAPDAAVAPAILATATPATVAAGETFMLAVEIENFVIVNPTTTPGVEPGKGHFHYQLDTWDTYVAAWTSSVTVAITGATAAGEHSLRVWLVDGSHAPIEPLTETTLTVTVE